MSRDNLSEQDEIIWGAAIHEWLEEGNNLPILSRVQSSGVGEGEIIDRASISGKF